MPRGRVAFFLLSSYFLHPPCMALAHLWTLGKDYFCFYFCFVSLKKSYAHWVECNRNTLEAQLALNPAVLKLRACSRSKESSFHIRRFTFKLRRKGVRSNSTRERWSEKMLHESWISHNYVCCTVGLLPTALMCSGDVILSWRATPSVAWGIFTQTESPVSVANFSPLLLSSCSSPLRGPLFDRPLEFLSSRNTIRVSAAAWPAIDTLIQVWL